MLFLFPAVLGALAVGAAFQLGRAMTHNRAVQHSAARMPEGAAHDIA